MRKLLEKWRAHMGNELSKHHASLIHKQTVPAVCVQVVISHNVNPAAIDPSLEKRGDHDYDIFPAPAPILPDPD